MEILSDTGGVDFRPYMERLHVHVQDHWTPLIPEEALPPMMASGSVTIEFAILKDGTIRGMKLFRSSGHVALDRAAWGAITSSIPLPPLPAEFTHDYLLLRCGFIYNMSAEVMAKANKQGQIYQQGLAAMRSGDWAGAERFMKQTVELDPAQDTAWQNLGRAQMNLRKYAEAEESFRKFLLLSPNDPQPYAHLAWALTAEKKYTDATELLEKRTSAAPQDGEAYRRLGHAYLLMHRSELAVTTLEKASQLLPNNDLAHYDLALAYLEVHRGNAAAASFDRSIELKSSDAKLNAAAYALAESNTHLELAETWANGVVSRIEAQLNQANLQAAQTGTPALLRNCSMYWDTLGWIRFQKGDPAAAEKYIQSAWELADDTTIGYHLARIYESQGNRNQAIETYAQVLGSVLSTREMTENEKDTRSRLAALLGGESLVDKRVNDSHQQITDRRSVSIDNTSGGEGTTDYWVIVGPRAKVTDLMPGDQKLDKLASGLRAASMPQSFPDAGTIKMPRAGTLVCASSRRPCVFTLLSAERSARSDTPAAANRGP
jgi:TonB family protein